MVLLLLSLSGSPDLSMQLNQESSHHPLSPSEIASFTGTAFTNFVSTWYCDPTTTLNWTCGGTSLAALSTAACSPDYPFLANC